MSQDKPVIGIDSGSEKQAAPLRFTHAAMATIFEVLVHGQGADDAQQAAWAAFDEVDRLEKELSRFLPSSDVLASPRPRPESSSVSAWPRTSASRRRRGCGRIRAARSM